MLECKTGTMRLCGGDFWENEYHTITFCEEDSYEDAFNKCIQLKSGSPREVKRAFVRVEE